MKFIVKLFPEITIKSASVRLRFIKILTTSIRNRLRLIDESVAVVRHWDHIEVRLAQSTHQLAIEDELRRIPGIHHFLAVQQHSYQDLADIFQQTLALYGEQLANKSFCVRVKRRGQHSFTSLDVERYVGGGLNQHIASAKVKLTAPDVTIHLEIEQDILLLVTARHQGLGGFPTGTQEDVLSLISGGFDSSVASYQLLRRGSRVHYCFFNLGGAKHQIGVKQVAYYLWQRYASSHKVRFVSIDFAPVVNEILSNIADGQMGVVLKRMMIRAASQMAERYGIQALVTGEALGQVSSQTLTNLRVIDEVSSMLILRPLIASDKEQIIGLARQIGTEDFAKTMPEYCGVISKSPTVKAIPAKIAEQERAFDFSLLTDAINNAEIIDIREIALQAEQEIVAIDLQTSLTADAVVIDIRAPDEQEGAPLQLASTTVLTVPFYKLATQFSQLPRDKTYFLYCQRGVMSRLQALYLHEQGFTNVQVFRPELQY